MDELSVAKQRFEIEVAPLAVDPQAMRQRLIQGLSPIVTFTHAPLACGEGGRTADGIPVRTVSSQFDRGKLSAGQWIELDGLLLRVGSIEASEIQPVLDALRQSGFVIRRVQLMRPSLEDLFIETVSTGTAESGTVAPPAFQVSPPKAPLA